MPHFIDDDVALPAAKVDTKTKPVSTPVNRWHGAGDFNALRTGLNDTKDFLRRAVVETIAPRLVPNDPAYGYDNSNRLNDLLASLSGTGRAVELPGGVFYFDAPTSGSNNWIDFANLTDVSLVGRGRNETVLIQQGDSDGGDAHLIGFDRSQRCAVRNLKVMQGIIKRPDPIQLNHLINVANNSGDATGVTDDITISDITFGKCIGDQLRFFGNTKAITNVRASNLILRGAGVCIQDWTPSTVYPAGAWVRNDSGKNYICKTAGTSASSGGPTGTSTDELTTNVGAITDGTAKWNYKAPRNGARSGISFQRGYSRVEVFNFFIDGAQNSPLDMEPTGSGTMEYANVHHGFIDNAFAGATAYAASFSGVSAGDRAKHNRLAYVTLLGGALSIISTEDLLLENVKSICNTLFAADTATPNVIIRQRNDNIQVKDVTVERGGACAAAPLIDVENPTGSGFSLDGFNMKQGTNANVVSIADCTRPVVRRGRINFTASTPAGKHGVAIAAINSNCNNPIVDDVVAQTSSGKFEAAIALITRSAQSMTNISATRIKSAGHASYGILLSKGDGTTFDAQPLINDISNGTDLAIRCENQANVAIDTIFPVSGGNIGDTVGIRQMQGTVAPEAVVTAPQGCFYVRINGDSTHLYFKATGTGNTGWVLVV